MERSTRTSSFAALTTSLLVIAVLAAGCGGDPDLGEPAAVITDISDEASIRSTEAIAGKLFVVRGDATVDGDRLSMAVHDQPVSWITDRPERRAGTMSPEALDRGWAAFGFGEDPPDAIFTTSTNSFAVTLTDPEWATDTLTFAFTAARIDGVTLPSGALGAAQLFIDDDAADCSYDETEAGFAGWLSIDVEPGPGSAVVPGCAELAAAVNAAFDGVSVPDDPYAPEFPMPFIGVDWTCRFAGVLSCAGPNGASFVATSAAV